MSYPKIFTHRDNPHAQVTIASAEQEAQLPEEYLPATGEGRQAAPADDLMLSPEYSAFLEQKDILEQGRKDLVEARAELEADRARLVNGYKADKAKLDEDRATLDAEIAAFHAPKTATTRKTKD